MAQLALTAGASPAFLSKNYVNRDCGISVSTGDTLKQRLYQMDFTAQWSSIGSSDIIDESITIALNQGVLQVSRSIDFVALMNVNLKNFLLEYSDDDGTTWATVTGFDYRVGTADFASTNKIAALASPVSANRLRLTMYRTQTANAEKLVGGFVAALGTFQTANCMDMYEPKSDEMRRDVRMADGSLSYGVQYRADSSIEFYMAKAGWRFVGSSEFDSFRSIKNAIEPVLWYPEPGDEVRNLYLARVRPGTFKFPYSTTYKGAGRDIELEIEEVGGG